MPDQDTIQKIANRLYTTFKSEGLPDANARILIGQSRHETASFSSNVFKQNNNIAGMKVPSIRKSPYILGAGTKAPSNEGTTPYAKYASIEDSARDLVHWLRYNKADWHKINTPDSYATFLKSKNYYGPTASFYAHQIQVFYDQMKNWVFKNPGKSIVFLISGIGLIAAGIYFLVKRKS